MLLSVALSISGALGAAGNVEGSGDRCNVAVPVVSTLRDADHEDSPLSEEAVHVKRAESSDVRSVKVKIEFIIITFNITSGVQKQ